jgi:hypothetical protein
VIPLIQCFSSGVPQNLRVPQNIVRGSQRNSGKKKKKKSLINTAPTEPLFSVLLWALQTKFPQFIFQESRDSSVITVTMLDIWGIVVRFPVTFASTSAPTRLPGHWLPRISGKIKRPSRAVGHSPPHSAEVKNVWSYVATSPYMPSWHAQQTLYLSPRWYSASWFPWFRPLCCSYARYKSTYISAQNLLARTEICNNNYYLSIATTISRMSLNFTLHVHCPYCDNWDAACLLRGTNYISK